MEGTGLSANCLLLSLPGYRHSEKYRRKWEKRLEEDPWRLVDEYRWVLPVLSGYITTPDGEEPAIIALSFTPRNANRIISLQNAIQFFRDPYHAEWRFRTIVISRIRDVEKCESFPVTLMSNAAQMVVESLQQRLSGQVPSNFRVARNLIDLLFSPNPRELLHAIGLVTRGEKEEEDEIEDEGEFDDSEWSEWEDAEEDEWDNTYEEPEEEEEEKEESDEFIPAKEIDEYHREEEELEAPPPYPQPSPPPPVEPLARHDEEEGEKSPPQQGSGTGISQIIHRLYSPDPRMLRAYGISLEEEQEEPSAVRVFLESLPPWPHMVIEVLLSLLSYFVPQASWGIFLLIGGRAGLRMILGAAFMSALFFLYQGGVGIRYWWLYALFALLGLAFYFAGVKRLYIRDHLKFELATATKHVADIAWQAIKPKRVDASAAGAAMMPGAVSVRDAKKEGLLGAIPDFLFLISPFLFIYPPFHPIGVALFLILWHLERKKAAPWAAGIILHTALEIAGYQPSVKMLIALWLFRLLSYITVRSPHDLTVEKVRAIPTELKNFYSMLVSNPLGALKFVWSGKKVRIQKTVEFEVSKVDDKIAAMIADLPEKTVASILSLLTPDQMEGWAKAAEIAGVAVPIIARARESKKFYHTLYQVRVPPVVRGEDILPDYRQAMMASFAQALAQTKKIMVNNGEMEIPRICRVSPQENSECALSPLPEPVIISNGTGVIVPIGTSYVYYTEDGRHRHYATGIVYDPDRSGHLLIVAPSGAGKSVFLRSLMNNLAVAAEKFPLRILYAEGKSELGGTERMEPFLTPFIFLSTGSLVLRWTSALLSIMDYRQAFHAALGKYLKDPSTPKELFSKRYGHILPQLIVILDEYYAASLLAKQMEQISVTDHDGKTLKISAQQFYSSALARVVVLGRSMGVSITLTTQSGRAEAILPALRENCTAVAGNPAKIPPQILSNLLGSDLTAMKQIAFQLTGNSASHLPSLFGYAFSSPRGATVAWIKHDGTYILSGDARAYPDEQPQWDVLFPAFYPRIVPAPRLFPMKRDEILRDAEMLVSAGLLQKPPACGWLKALAVDPFDTEEEFLGLGEENMLKYLLASKEQMSVGPQEE